MALVVHHLERSRSHRVLWLVEELGVDYALVEHKRHPETMRAGDSLKAVHPLGRAPVVELDGVVLAESGNIIEALIEAHGPNLRPTPGTPEAALYRFWLHYAEGSLMPPQIVWLVFDRLRKAPLPFFLKPIAKAIAGKVDAAYTLPEIANHLDFVEDHLSQHAYFAGDAFSGADIQMSFGVQAAVDSKHPVGPSTREWLRQMQARPAWQRAIEKGGPVTTR